MMQLGLEQKICFIFSEILCSDISTLRVIVPLSFSNFVLKIWFYWKFFISKIKILKSKLNKMNKLRGQKSQWGLINLIQDLFKIIHNLNWKNQLNFSIFFLFPISTLYNKILAIFQGVPQDLILKLVILNVLFTYLDNRFTNLANNFIFNNKNKYYEFW